MDIDAFIDRWSTARPEPASHETVAHDDVFERGVARRGSEGVASTLRIDLYKRGRFGRDAAHGRKSGVALWQL